MKYICILFILLVLSFCSPAQVLCVKCYNQNARVLPDTINLILNGGFENNNCNPNAGHDTSFCPSSQYYHCDIANWICTGGGINTYACIIDTSLNNGGPWSNIVEGANAVYFGNAHAIACSAVYYDTSCITNSGCEVTGIPAGYPSAYNIGYGGNIGVNLSQTVTGLTLGSAYILEFWAGGEDGSISKGLFAVDVGFGNIFLRDPVTPYGTGIGTRYVIAFTSVSTSHTIKFTNWGHIGNSTELVVDDVRLFKAANESNPCATGISEINNNNKGVNIFPNPISVSSIIQLNIQVKNAEVVIYDVLGKEVMRKMFSGNEMKIDRGAMAAGVYIVSIKEEEKQWMTKLVVE